MMSQEPMLADTSRTLPRSRRSSDTPSSSGSLGFSVIRTFTFYPIGLERVQALMTDLLLSTSNGQTTGKA